MLDIRRGCLVPVALLNIRRGGRREHPNQHCLLNTTVVVQLPVAYTQGNTEMGSSDLLSHPVAMLLLRRKKRGKNLGMRRTYFRSGTLPDRASSGHVTLSLPVKRPH